MNDKPVIRDERTDAVVDRSCTHAYLVLVIGLIVSIGVRGLALHQNCWDLIALWFVSSVVGLAHLRAKHVQLIAWRWALLSALAGCVVMAALLHFLKR